MRTASYRPLCDTTDDIQTITLEAMHCGKYTFETMHYGKYTVSSFIQYSLNTEEWKYQSCLDWILFYSKSESHSKRVRIHSTWVNIHSFYSEMSLFLELTFHSFLRSGHSIHSFWSEFLKNSKLSDIHSKKSILSDQSKNVGNFHSKKCDFSL